MTSKNWSNREMTDLKVTKLGEQVSRRTVYEEVRNRKCPYCGIDLYEGRVITVEFGEVRVKRIIYVATDTEQGHDYKSHSMSKCRVKKLMEAADYWIDEDTEICFNCDNFTISSGTDWMDMAYITYSCGKYRTNLKYDFSGTQIVVPNGTCDNWVRKGSKEKEE